AKSFDMIIDSLGGELLFLPHSIESHENRDDRVVGEDIASVMTNHRNVHVIRKEYSTAELKALMGKSDLMIGARIHSVIGALSMGTPSCALSRKSDVRSVGLVGSMLKQGKWIYHIEYHTNQKLVNLVQRMAAERENISSCLIPIVRAVKKDALLNGALLKKVLESQ
ncbi:polysaccharide pyruvyl transferase family protein, partial [bacterium]|nr:polysaccharide pyruvyl transferase family protein [bacterium]